MDYWAKDIYSWGIFSAEVYPCSSTAIQRTIRIIFCCQVTWTLRTTSSGGSTPPEHCLQRPLYSVKYTAWVSISKHGIIGPFWFEGDNERSVTINTERYVQVLGKFWTAFGRRRGVVRVFQWFQQDGATPHTSNESLAWLQQRFPDWLAVGVTRSGHRIHWTWTTQIFICGDTLRTGCMATTPRLSLT